MDLFSKHNAIYMALMERLMTQQGTKYDQDKPRMDLLDPPYLEGTASVLGFGATKYAAHNWRNGIAVSRLLGAAYRHLGAIQKGENLDPESGLPHVYHLSCCVMFLASMLETRPDMDDRWKGNHQPLLETVNRAV